MYSKRGASLVSVDLATWETHRDHRDHSDPETPTETIETPRDSSSKPPSDTAQAQQGRVKEETMEMVL